MSKYIEYKNIYIYTSLAIISFGLNFYVASKGVFPVDTFIHYDNGYRILLGDNPVKDYWIVHGFIIDYLQAFFFKIFGNSWHSYIAHSSIFNSAITLATFFTFRLLKIDILLSCFFSISFAILAYPVSGTPFLDLHSSFFSLLGIYFAIIAILKNKNSFWFFTSILLCFAFFSKQVPAGYTIIILSLFNIYLAVIKKNFKIFLFFAAGGIFFLIILLVFLLFREISIYNFILQIFLFPQSIGASRYDTYILNIKNVILNFKFIHLIVFFIFISNFVIFKKNKNYFKSKNFEILLIILIFYSTTLFHQIYTKNQIYIFFLIPFLSGFLIYFNNQTFINFKKIITVFVISLCLFTTIKYNKRFNIERKFHELNNTNLNDSISAKIIHKNFKGLKWISPYFTDPNEEAELIKNFLFMLDDDQDEKMVISQYNFFSSLLNKRLNSPSRTYDSISYPRKDTKYFEEYQKYLIKIINNNKIKKIYIFEPYSKYNINHIIYNYIPDTCFEKNKPNKHSLVLKIINCKELK